ncbi:MAG: hypothetical protein OEV25_17875 [Deltaproteobacteria bacterium]|nr:hypothetical protein [Deltaproteobacteria bacterium]
MNLESNNINTVISNVETLLTEMKALRDANVEFIAREENSGKSQSFIFYTHDQKVADRVFKNGYKKTTTEDLLDTTSNDSKENNILEHKRLRMNETLNVIFKAIAGPIFEEERLVAEPAEDLPDTLFSDLEEIGLSTIDREAIQENAVEPLPEELFDDLSDEDSQVKG